MSTHHDRTHLNNREVRAVRKELLAARAAANRRQIAEARNELARTLTPAGLFTLLRRRSTGASNGLPLGGLLRGRSARFNGGLQGALPTLPTLLAIPGAGLLLGRLFRPLKWAALGWSAWQGIRAGRAIRARRVQPPR
ncbi:hypothetical protein [Chitinasiproducens palmae]|uniref:Uncharacterized protein n=1 Tax=Chitinasiproducens palmae TaxID=1770053 RepID=A0A1H2PSW7_9BURK|nr:hypothetical protein [Chitinasiproducens palmae]SDV50145.1 hypothetical protein SAMN05216551_110158 [Chitinasiproducens palmae]